MNGVTVTGATQLEARLRAVQKAPQTMMGVLAHRVVLQAGLRAPRKTGNLVRTINVASVSRTEAVVVARANYAGFVEHGTGLYGPKHARITPAQAKVMRWPAGTPGGPTLRLSGRVRRGRTGAYVYARSTKGMKAHPFLLPGAQAAIAQGGLSQTIVAAWNEAA